MNLKKLMLGKMILGKKSRKAAKGYVMWKGVAGFSKLALIGAAGWGALKFFRSKYADASATASP